MDFFDDELPSTSGTTCIPGLEYSCLATVQTEDLSRGDTPNTVSELSEQPSSIENISNRVNELVERINTNRTSDQKVMDTFQEKLMEKMTAVYQQLKEHMYLVYEDNSNNMQVKLKELTEVLETCSRLNQELLDANQALSSLSSLSQRQCLQ